MQLNTYVYVSAALVLLALILATGNIISSARSHDLSNDVQTVRLSDDQLAVVQAEAVFDFAYPELSRERQVNPFTLEDEVAIRGLANLPMPPPPKLRIPMPPMLPLPGEWGGK